MSKTRRDTERARYQRALKAWFRAPLGTPLPPWPWPQRWTQMGVPAWYKRLLRQAHRAQVRQALRRGEFDSLPREMKTAGYYW